MLLSILSKEEKINFVDLVSKLILVDGEISEVEKIIIKKLRIEIGDEGQKTKKKAQSYDQLVKYFSEKPESTRRIVFMNLFSASLLDEWYNVEQHQMLIDIQNSFKITDKVKNDLMKIIYAERDLREKAKRVVQE